mmetsp:Transcript_34785/g.96026  ORF Transcript_34785/g.96026 Transcript_34785/m.96026 type:complete len:183 (+) Transcript_34785:632-1180(+)
MSEMHSGSNVVQICFHPIEARKEEREAARVRHVPKVCHRVAAAEDARVRHGQHRVQGRQVLQPRVLRHAIHTLAHIDQLLLCPFLLSSMSPCAAWSHLSPSVVLNCGDTHMKTSPVISAPGTARTASMLSRASGKSPKSWPRARRLSRSRLNIRGGCGRWAPYSRTAAASTPERQRSVALGC